ncbi:MAG TPA: glycosyltransferase, partial [Candidatus Dormibacteraeota bacterium]
MSEHCLAAVVPAWNEEAAIADVVRGLRAAGACCVAVVDAGSTDATQRLAREAGALVLEERRRGYGLACQA